MRCLIPLIIFTSMLMGCSSSKKTATYSEPIFVDDGTTEETTVASPVATYSSAGKKTYSRLQHKYAGLIHSQPAEITNTRLYSFIDEWLYTPYAWGGTTKKGIDCSAFVQQLINHVYKVRIPRTSEEQFYTSWIELYESKNYLREGDLVFFKTLPNTTVSHIGFYLGNKMFVNSSSSKGVSIASLDEPFWRKTYVASGRIKQSQLAAYKTK